MGTKPDPKPGTGSAFELLKSEVKGALARHGAAYAISVSLEMYDAEQITADQFIANMRGLVELADVTPAEGHS